MHAFLTPLLGLVLFQDAGQDKDPKAVFQEVMQSLPRAQRGMSREEAEAAGKQRTQLIEKALTEHAALWASGDGLHYRGILLQQSGKRDAATDSFLAHAKGAGDTELGQQSLLIATQSLMYGDPHKAQQVYQQIDKDKLPERARGQFERLAEGIETNVARVDLNGKKAPAIAASHVLGGEVDADAFGLSKYAGKVVVLDFWATWCPPCRAVIPDLVKLQEQHGGEGVQVLGMTRFYGRGMDFADASAEKPHGGKSVAELSEEAELEVNRNFVKAFDVNYPIVFTKNDEGKNDYHVTGIPTVFVIDRQGSVVGSVVGGDHEKIEALVARGLGKGGAVEAAGSRSKDKAKAGSAGK